MDHFYKTFLVRSVPVSMRKRKKYQIIPNCGRSAEGVVNTTLTLGSAKKLIDVWEATTECPNCGRPPRPYHHHCALCDGRIRTVSGILRKVLP